MSDNEPIRLSAVPRPGERKKLGRGLGALLGEARREEPVDGVEGEHGDARSGPASGLASLRIAAIEPLPGQPRTRFDESALEELAQSIAARGVIQPIIVRPLAGGRYQLVAGERRWRAAQKARLHEIPAIVRDLDEREVVALALIENIQREDLNPVEEARAYSRLSEGEGMTQTEIARLVDKSRSHVANLQRLLALPDAVLDLVEEGTLSMGHARALIGHEDAETLARQASERNLSVREVERLARKGKQDDAKSAGSGKGRSAEDDADIAAVQQSLEDFLGLSVRIAADADPSSGAMTIRYRTIDQLDLLCQRLTGQGI